jgi:diguanylate cyclase (GGDEF)-like protein
MLSGVLSQFAPALIQGQAIVKLDYRYLPALCLGLVALVLLLNFYLIGQRRALDLVRYDLIREMATNQSLQQVAMVDPETQFFSRAAISKLLASEISRCNRFGSDLTFAIFEPDNFQKVRLKESPFTADRMIVELADVLRKTFRGSDTLFRYSKSEFLLVMPKTSKIEAVPALMRLIDNLDHWNMNSDSSFELSLDYGIASYQSGEPIDVALRAAEHSKRSLLSAKTQIDVAESVARRGDVETEPVSSEAGSPA